MQHCPGVPAVWAQVGVCCGPCFYVSLHPENARFYVALRDFIPPQTMLYVIRPPEKYVSRDVTPRNR
jgi:hypothetical protein